MRILLASASERRGSILRERFSNIEQNALKDVNETVPRGFISDQVEQVVSRKANAANLNRHKFIENSTNIVLSHG